MGYPVHTRVLEPTPVDYFCPPLTPGQLRILDHKQPFAYAVNKVINEYFPLHLSASIRQYQYYKDTQYSIQQAIRHLQEKNMCYMEKAIGILTGLENANVIGRLLAHSDILAMELAPNPAANAHYSNAVTGFRGAITQSALDTTANPHHSPRQYPNDEEDTGINISIGRNSRACFKEQNHWEAPRPRMDCIRIPLHTYRRCHRCYQQGHIHKHCPLQHCPWNPSK